MLVLMKFRLECLVVGLVVLSIYDLVWDLKNLIVYLIIFNILE